MGKAITVWGSPGSGKPMLPIWLSKKIKTARVEQTKFLLTSSDTNIWKKTGTGTEK